MIFSSNLTLNQINLSFAWLDVLDKPVKMKLNSEFFKRNFIRTHRANWESQIKENHLPVDDYDDVHKRKTLLKASLVDLAES